MLNEFFRFCSKVKTTLCWVLTCVIATPSSSIKNEWQKAEHATKLHGVADIKFQLSWISHQTEGRDGIAKS